jgi:hypothetical protein
MKQNIIDFCWRKDGEVLYILDELGNLFSYSLESKEILNIYKNFSLWPQDMVASNNRKILCIYNNYRILFLMTPPQKLNFLNISKFPEITI